MKILETEQLIIRHLQPTDLDEFCEICGDAEIMRYVGNSQPLSRDQTEKWIEKSQENYKNHGFGCFAAATKDANLLVGYRRLINPTVSGTTEAEIIYGFRKEYWGKGLAGETAKAIIGFGLSNAVRIES